MEYYADPKTVGVAAGTIDEESVTRQLVGPSNHIFVSEKASWFTLPDDGLPRYEKFSPTFQKMLDTWKSGQKSPDGE